MSMNQQYAGLVWLVRTDSQNRSRLGHHKYQKVHMNTRSSFRRISEATYLSHENRGDQYLASPKITSCKVVSSQTLTSSRFGIHCSLSRPVIHLGPLVISLSRTDSPCPQIPFHAFMFIPNPFPDHKLGRESNTHLT